MQPNPPPATILLVEDEDVLRAAATRTLSRDGYQVLGAADGPKALEVCQAHPGPIELLLTDLLMPGMTGHDLAARIVLLRPAIKLLFTSGYSQRTALDKGLLPPGQTLLEKPFTPESLSAKVREVLEG